MPAPLFWTSTDQPTRNATSSSSQRKASYNGPFELHVFAEFSKQRKAHYNKVSQRCSPSPPHTPPKNSRTSSIGSTSTSSIGVLTTDRDRRGTFTEQYLSDAAFSHPSCSRDTWDGIAPHTMLHDMTMVSRAAAKCPTEETRVLWRCQDHKAGVSEACNIKQEDLVRTSCSGEGDGTDCTCYDWIGRRAA